MATRIFVYSGRNASSAPQPGRAFQNNLVDCKDNAGALSSVHPACLFFEHRILSAMTVDIDESAAMNKQKL